MDGQEVNFTATHLFTWEERGTVRVKCLTQEHNTVFSARARIWTIRLRVERTNHEASTPLPGVYAEAQLVTKIIRIDTFNFFLG